MRRCRPGKPLLQLRRAALRYAGLAVRDLQIPPRDAHPLIECERAGERGDRLVHQTTAEVQHAEIVVRAWISRIDPPRERAQHVRFPLSGDAELDHSRQLRRTARKIALKESGSGSSRKKPRNRSPISSKENSVSTQHTAKSTVCGDMQSRVIS